MDKYFLCYFSLIFNVLWKWHKRKNYLHPFWPQTKLSVPSVTLLLCPTRFWELLLTVKISKVNTEFVYFVLSPFISKSHTFSATFFFLGAILPPNISSKKQQNFVFSYTKCQGPYENIQRRGRTIARLLIIQMSNHALPAMPASRRCLLSCIIFTQSAMCAVLTFHGQLSFPFLHQNPNKLHKIWLEIIRNWFSPHFYRFHWFHPRETNMSDDYLSQPLQIGGTGEFLQTVSSKIGILYGNCHNLNINF